MSLVVKTFVIAFFYYLMYKEKKIHSSHYISITIYLMHSIDLHHIMIKSNETISCFKIEEKKTESTFLLNYFGLDFVISLIENTH